MKTSELLSPLLTWISALVDLDFGVLSSYPYRSGWMAEGTLNSFDCTGPFSLGLLFHLPMCGFLIPCFDRFLKKLCQITSHNSSLTLLVSKQIKHISYLYCSLVLADIILVFCWLHFCGFVNQIITCL